MRVSFNKNGKEIVEETKDLYEGLVHHKEIHVSKIDKAKLLVSVSLLAHGLATVQLEEVAASVVSGGEVLHKYQVGGHEWRLLHPKTAEQQRNICNYIQDPRIIGELDFYDSAPTPA